MEVKDVEISQIFKFLVHPFFKNVRYAIHARTSMLREKLCNFIVGVVPPIEVDIDDTKTEIWNDIAALYYKFEVYSHKRGFREVMHEISEKMRDDKWDSIYQKMYRTEHRKCRSRFP
jgi:DNA-binding cell septation regulator SpoVG